MEALKASEKKGDISQDEQKRGEGEVQKMTDTRIGEIDDIYAAKEKEIMGQ